MSVFSITEKVDLQRHTKWFSKLMDQIKEHKLEDTDEIKIEYLVKREYGSSVTVKELRDLYQKECVEKGRNDAQALDEYLEKWLEYEDYDVDNFSEGLGWYITLPN